MYFLLFQQKKKWFDQQKEVKYLQKTIKFKGDILLIFLIYSQKIFFPGEFENYPETQTNEYQDPL